MVYGIRRFLQTDRERVVVRINKDVIDMGAPQMRSAGVRRRPHKERKRTAASPGDHRGYAKPPGENEQLQDNQELLDLGTSTVQHPDREQHKAGGCRQSGRYAPRTPNPRLYPGVQNAERLRQSPLITSRVKKQLNQRLCESPIRHKRRKIKARCLVPNPRLYQAPPNRPRVYPVPPQNPVPSWSPPSKLGPQETASQIALRLSQRTIIPFRQFLPTAVQPGPVRKRLGSSRAPALREKTRPVKSRPKTERVAFREKNRSAKSPREKNEPLTLQPKSARREELLPESTLFDSPPPTIRHSILKNGTVPPSLDSVPQLNYAAGLPKRYVPRSQHFKPGVLLESRSSSTIQPVRAYTPPTLAEPIAMASPHCSVTPEDVSDGNDSLSSAPSEYLAEFLSAIMGRKYAEALKYCRLILHYEPNNATARSFYPILRHKLGQDKTAMSKYSTTVNEGKVPGSSNSESGSGSSAAGGQIVTRTTGSPGAEDLDETSGDSDESDAADYLASLSLDSSGKSSRCVSPVANDNGTDSGSEGSAEAAGVAAAELKTACWLADDNGNPSPHTRKHKSHRAHDDDVENDNNAASGDHTLLLNDASLRQLRAQFACSTK